MKIRYWSAHSGHGERVHLFAEIAPAGILTRCGLVLSGYEDVGDSSALTCRRCAFLQADDLASFKNPRLRPGSAIPSKASDSELVEHSL